MGFYGFVMGANEQRKTGRVCIIFLYSKETKQNGFYTGNRKTVLTAEQQGFSRADNFWNTL
jgi:hypothetical protein